MKNIQNKIIENWWVGLVALGGTLLIMYFGEIIIFNGFMDTEIENEFSWTTLKDYFNMLYPSEIRDEVIAAGGNVPQFKIPFVYFAAILISLGNTASILYRANKGNKIGNEIFVSWAGVALLLAFITVFIKSWYVSMLNAGPEYKLDIIIEAGSGVWAAFAICTIGAIFVTTLKKD